MKLMCIVHLRRDRFKGVKIYIPDDAVKIIGDNIVFNLKRLEMKRPSLDCKHYRSIKTGTLSIALPSDEIADYVGHYKLFQKDEDTFIFKKVNNEPHD